MASVTVRLYSGSFHFCFSLRLSSLRVLSGMGTPLFQAGWPGGRPRGRRAGATPSCCTCCSNIRVAIAPMNGVRIYGATASRASSTGHSNSARRGQAAGRQRARPAPTCACPSWGAAPALLASLGPGKPAHAAVGSDQQQKRARAAMPAANHDMGGCWRVGPACSLHSRAAHLNLGLGLRVLPGRTCAGASAAARRRAPAGRRRRTWRRLLSLEYRAAF